jgi:hypothetical protein
LLKDALLPRLPIVELLYRDRKLLFYVVPMVRMIRRGASACQHENGTTWNNADVYTCTYFCAVKDNRWAGIVFPAAPTAYDRMTDSGLIHRLCAAAGRGFDACFGADERAVAAFDALGELDASFVERVQQFGFGHGASLLALDVDDAVAGEVRDGAPRP